MKTATRAVLVGTGLILGGLLSAATLPAQEALREAHNECGNMAILEGKYCEADRRFGMAIRDAETAGVRDVVFANSVHGRGRAFEKLGQFAEAESHYNRALILYEKLEGINSTQIAPVLHNLAGLYESRGNCAEAKPLHKLAFARELKVLRGTIETHFATENYSSAKEVCVAAITVARQAEDAAAAEELLAQLAEIKSALQTHAGVEQAIRTLSETPNEPQASLLLGRFLCFVKQDWDNGLPLLVVSANESLYAPVLAERVPPQTPDQQVLLADAWWDLARDADPGERVSMQRRAAYWYLAALPALPAGFERVKAQRRVNELSAK